MNTQTLPPEVHKILKPSDILQIDHFKKSSSQEYSTAAIIVKVMQFDFDTITTPNETLEPVHFVI